MSDSGQEYTYDCTGLLNFYWYITSLHQKHFIAPTDAHYYKNHGMLKQFRIMTLAPCFGSRGNHHQGAVLCLAKTTKYGFSVLVSTDFTSLT